MEQIFMIEILIKRIELALAVPIKDEYELFMEARENERNKKNKKAIESAAFKKGSKKKAKKKRKKKKKKEKKKNLPPNLEKAKLMKFCSVQANCLPIFHFLMCHENFIPPLLPPPDKKKKKGKKGKKAKKEKPKKKKKGKKNNKKKKPVQKVRLPSELLPNPPFYGVGNTVMFASRPSRLKALLQSTPISLSVWNKNQNMRCTGICKIRWHQTFMDCLKRTEELNPVDMDQGNYRNTKPPELQTVTVEILKHLKCEQSYKPCGEIELFIRLSCLGDRLLSHMTTVPERTRYPCRHYIKDEFGLKEIEVARNWQQSPITFAPPIAYFYGGPAISYKNDTVDEQVYAYEDFVSEFTEKDLVVMSMGFPKGPCGGVNCPKRMAYRGDDYDFILTKEVNGKIVPGSFVNQRDIHGPCGRLTCPLAVKARDYIKRQGAYKPCMKPCTADYY